MRTYVRISIWLAGLCTILMAGVAAAGGAGSIQLVRPVEKVAVGEVTVYLQALQHNVHPVNDATVTLTAVGPDGTTVTASGERDAAFGNDNVYVVRAVLDKPGTWKATLTAESVIWFPPFPFEVEVLPAGSKVPDPGPVRPHKEGGQSHTHMVTPAPAQSASTSASAPPEDAAIHGHGPGAHHEADSSAQTLRIGVATAAVAVATGALLWWRRGVQIR